jgi:hypothetical protein
MALFMIKRNVQGASPTDYDAAVFRAISCAYEFDGLRWVRSYWDRQSGYSYCIYEADSAEQIREHSTLSQIACDEVFQVTDIDPESYDAGRLNELEPTTT